ncbi:MAG: LamG domain-containing protein [Planctomycetes bacterium]|nr:LamG domain-containing protein [Planctomycetota bacterium]
MKRLSTWHLWGGNKIFLAILAIVLAVGVKPVNAALIGYWDFNEAIDMADAVDSVAGNDAVLNNAATRTAGPAGFGRALSLDGSAGTNAVVGVVPSLALTGSNYTVAFWAMPTGALPTSGPQRMITMDDGLNSSGGYSFGFFSGNFRLGVGHNNGSNNNAIITGATFSNDWIHFAITYDAASVGSERKVYKNGNLVGTTAIAGGNILNDGDDSLVFGDIPPFNQNFEGALDDIRMYDNTLTQPEVAALLTAIPEPSSLLLTVAGMVSLLVARRKRR